MLRNICWEVVSVVHRWLELRLDGRGYTGQDVCTQD